MSHLTSKGIYKGGRFYKNPAITFAEEKAQGENPQEPDLTGSKIVEFFKGKTVFLTGATGFMGKVLMEKLLRSCPDLEEIIVICREKKGKNMNTRMDDVFEDPLYARLLKIDPKFRQRIKILAGDISKPRLGISENDRNLITSKANVIMHGAATVRFDEPLKKALQTNFLGTQQMLELASECSNLVSMLYVSTAFSNCPHQTIEEKFYPVPIEPNELINLIETKTEEEMDEMTPSLLGKWPNTYSFSKALTESLIKESAGTIPLSIIRPSIITSTYNEPIRGWTDSIWGPAGSTMGTGLGIIRTTYCDGDSIAEIIPMDFVSNAIIAAAYKQSITKSDEIQIYNCVTSPQSPLTWQQFVTMNHRYGTQVPPIGHIWSCWIILTKHKMLHQLLMLMLHIIPAAIVDAAAIVKGNKPQLSEVYNKIHKYCDVTAFFSVRNWTFSNTNVQSLWSNLSPRDRIVFPFNVDDMSWDYYGQMYSMGIRTYLIKDDPSTITQAKIKYNRFWVLDAILHGIFYYGILRLMYSLLMMVFFWM